MMWSQKSATKMTIKQCYEQLHFKPLATCIAIISPAIFPSSGGGFPKVHCCLCQQGSCGLCCHGPVFLSGLAPTHTKNQLCQGVTSIPDIPNARYFPIPSPGDSTYLWDNVLWQPLKTAASTLLVLASVLIKPGWTSGAVSQMPYWFTTQQWWKDGERNTTHWILKGKR